MLCSSCNKFATNDASGEPEIDLSADFQEADTPEEGQEQANHVVHVNGTVRIVLTSECCGVELKESTFDVDEDIELEERKCECTEFEAELEGAETTERQQTETTRRLKSGKVKVTPIKNYRYAKKFYGAAGELTVTCGCGATVATREWKDEVQASGMDEL